MNSDDLQELAQKIEKHDRKIQKERANIERKVEEVSTNCHKQSGN